MKLTIFGRLIVYVYIFYNIRQCNGEVFSKGSRFDLFEIGQNVKKMIESAQNLGGINQDFLMNSDVHEKLIRSKLLNLIPIFMTISTKNYRIKRCLQDLWYLRENLNTEDIKDSWAWQMIDSFGRPEAGVLEANFRWIGNFDECTNAYAPKKIGSDAGGYHGHYCSLQLDLDVVPITVGFCLPETCNPSDFVEILNISSLIPPCYKPDLKVKVDSLTCKSNTKNISKVGIITIQIISVFIFLVFCGTSVTAYRSYTNSKPKEDVRRYEGDLKSVAIDFDSSKLAYGIPKIHFAPNNEVPSALSDSSNLVLRQDPTKARRNADATDVKTVDQLTERKHEGFVAKCDALLNCFCLFTNGSKLFSTEIEEGHLSCIHGIRFLSIAWIILSHVFLAHALVVKTWKDVALTLDNIYSQVFMNGWYAVDSFFVLSGFLMAYLYFQELTKRRSEISWFNFYCHRFLRITPVYMITLAFYATVAPLLGSGPFWYDYEVEETCQKTWWWNLFYINNFQNFFVGCMPWSWYLANDMQFFIVSPLFLITFWRWPKMGYSVLALFLCISWISGFAITYYYGLVAGSISNPKDIAKDFSGFLYKWYAYTNKIYLRPYARIAPYLIGIALGHVIFKRRNASVKINKIYLWIGWLTAVPVAIYCVCGLYDQTPGIVGASFYNALSKTAWGLSVAWVIFVCLSGHGGIVDKFLSCKFFIPLSRLTYCAYLVHPIIILHYMLTLRSTVSFSTLTSSLLFQGLIILTFAISAVVSLVFESPLIRLEKLVTNKLQSRCKNS